MSLKKAIAASKKEYEEEQKRLAEQEERNLQRAMAQSSLNARVKNSNTMRRMHEERLAFAKATNKSNIGLELNQSEVFLEEPSFVLRQYKSMDGYNAIIYNINGEDYDPAKTDITTILKDLTPIQLTRINRDKILNKRWNPSTYAQNGLSGLAYFQAGPIGAGSSSGGSSGGRRKKTHRRKQRSAHKKSRRN